MTELIWDGKYDSNGKRNAPLRVSLPFQTVETVNESVQQRQIMLDLFSAGRDCCCTAGLPSSGWMKRSWPSPGTY